MELEFIFKYIDKLITKNHIKDEDEIQNIYLYALESINSNNLEGKQIDIKRLKINIYRKIKERRRNNTKKDQLEYLVSSYSYNINFDLIDLKIDLFNLLLESNLTSRELNVIILRYGLIDNHPMTRKEIVEEYIGPCFGAYSSEIVKNNERKGLWTLYFTDRFKRKNCEKRRKQNYEEIW